MMIAAMVAAGLFGLFVLWELGAIRENSYRTAKLLEQLQERVDSRSEPAAPRLTDAAELRGR